MKNTWIVLFALLSFVFCANVFATEENNIDSNDVELDSDLETQLDNAETNNSNYRVSDLLYSIQRKGDPRQYNGMRVKIPGKKTVWLVVNGKRRVLTYKAYRNLFKNWDDVVSDWNVGSLPIGKPMVRNTVLFSTGLKGTPFIIDDSGKRRISAAVFKAYGFNRKKIIPIPYPIFEKIPYGPAWK